MDIAHLRLLVLPASAVVAFCVGLGAAGINVLKVVQASSLRKILSIVAGACGLATLAFYLLDCHDPVFAQFAIEENRMHLFTALGCGIIALCVGLSAFNINVLKVVQATSARRVLEFVAGILGAHGLILYFHFHHCMSCAQ